MLLKRVGGTLLFGGDAYNRDVLQKTGFRHYCGCVLLIRRADEDACTSKPTLLSALLRSDR
jgi:hypothetical protein